MSLAKASLFTAASTLIKILVALVVGKLIAVQFGPEGVGLAGNYRQLITVLGVLAGAGIFNGVTKYIAEYQIDNNQLAQRKLLGTASYFVLIFSISIGILFFLFAAFISVVLFDDAMYAPIVRILAILQFTIAYGNLLLAIIKGYRDALSNALSVIIGAIFALCGFVILLWQFRYQGALIGLALLPALSLFPAFYFLYRKQLICWAMLIPNWDRDIALKLSKFTLMTLVTSVTLPVAYYLLRKLILRNYGLHEVGIWQGVSTISDAYLQFITAAFSVYLLPTFSRIKNPLLLAKEVSHSLKLILSAVIIISTTVWLLRDVVIWMLFTDKFSEMRTLFAWQLTGDVLKVGCYVFGYLIISQAKLRFYILAEIIQFTLLVLFSFLLIPTQGALGATKAYMMTYICYFTVCMVGFMVYRNYANQHPQS